MLTISVTMPDLDRQEIEIPCPRCALETTASLGEVRRCEVIICRGCKANLRLEDHLASWDRAKRQLQAAIAALGDL